MPEVAAFALQHQVVVEKERIPTTRAIQQRLAMFRKPVAWEVPEPDALHLASVQREDAACRVDLRCDCRVRTDCSRRAKPGALPSSHPWVANDTASQAITGQHVRAGRTERPEMGATTMPKVNPVQVQKYLGGIEYPVDKQQLVERAQEQGADDDVRQLLERLPMDRFNSPNDVSEAIGKAQM